MMVYDEKRGMEMEMNLDRLMPGFHGIVTSVNTDELLRLRLRDFGLVNGTKVTVRYKSPDGGVTALELRGTVVALRTCELRKIRVRLI